LQDIAVAPTMPTGQIDRPNEEVGDVDVDLLAGCDGLANGGVIFRGWCIAQEIPGPALVDAGQFGRDLAFGFLDGRSDVGR
jgi:hypothetical protein